MTSFVCERCPQECPHERRKIPTTAQHRLSGGRLLVNAEGAVSLPNIDRGLDEVPSVRTHRSTQRVRHMALSHRVSERGFFYLEVWIGRVFPALGPLKAYSLPPKEATNPFIAVVRKNPLSGQVCFQL